MPGALWDLRRRSARAGEGNSFLSVGINSRPNKNDRFIPPGRGGSFDRRVERPGRPKVYSSRLICLTGELPENGARRVELGYIAWDGQGGGGSTNRARTPRPAAG